METTVKRKTSIALFSIMGVAVFSTIGGALKLLVETPMASNQPATISPALVGAEGTIVSVRVAKTNLLNRLAKTQTKAKPKLPESFEQEFLPPEPVDYAPPPAPVDPAQKDKLRRYPPHTRDSPNNMPLH